MVKNTSIIFLLYFVFGSTHTANAQGGTWTLMHGTTASGNSGNFGIKGIASPSNEPPGLYEATEWTDLQGNFWLFGGMGGGYSRSALWKFDPITNMWTWINGDSTSNSPAVYGVKGVADTNNNPGARGFGSLSWTDNQNNLWLFGGYKVPNGPLADLWKYSIATNTWTWMSGVNTVWSSGLYGTKGVASVNNFPKSRAETSASWVDSSGNLWLFGGQVDANDLWKYDVVTNMWTWMKGDSVASFGNYGIKGVPSNSNEPCSRDVYSRWKDASGNFWLFGGFSYLPNGYLNDLWKYDLSTNMWTWVNGSDTIQSVGDEGIQCINTSLNCPSARMESKACWTDAENNFWMFGGYTDISGLTSYNDLWYYNVQYNEWTLIDGGSGPSARAGSTSFKDTNGNFWLFSGTSSSDLWRYIPDTNCIALTSLVPSIIEPCSNQDCFIVSPNPNGGIFNLQINEKLNDFNITITDIQGRKILNKLFINSSSIQPIQLDISNQPNGFYYILLNSNSRQYSSKILMIK